MAPASASSSSAEPAVPDRLPPYSEAAERGVLGSILLDYEKVLDLCLVNQIQPDSFYVPAHRIVYEAVLDLQKRNEAIDALTVGQRLERAGRLDQIGGAVFLDRLVDSTPTAAHAEYYINVVRQNHLLRMIIQCAREAERACYQSQDDADIILDRAEQSFLNITEGQHGRIKAWDAAVKDTIRQIDDVLNGAATLGGISTGLANLDAISMGLRKSEMIVLAARPGMGKTSLAMNIAENVALGRNRDHKSRPVAVFSLEMSQEALALRMLCGHAEVQARRIQRGGGFSRAAFRRLTQAASTLGKAPIFVDDTGGLDIIELRARARRMHKKYDIELIVIDYLQLLNSREYARQGRQLETANISSNIKAMAKELAVPVLVLSQLSRAPEQRDKKSGKPKLSDLRDSGAIEQDADMVWLLRRPIYYAEDDDTVDATLAIVDVAKQRNGPTGEVELNFFEEFTRFRDRTHGVDETDQYATVKEADPVQPAEEPI